MDSKIDDGQDHYFLWLSDLHYDPQYATPEAYKYPSASCTSNYASPIGDHGCDSPKELVRAAFEHAVNVTAARTPSSPTFVVVSGDSIRHGIDMLFEPGDFHEGAEGRADNSSMADSAEEHAASAAYHSAAMGAVGEILRELVSMLATAFPESEIIMSIGNNDVVPDYYLQLQDEDTPLGSSNLTSDSAGMLGVIYKALSNNGQTQQPNTNETSKNAIITSDDEWTFLRGGYYSRNLHEGTLTVLSLNTVLYSGNFEPGPINEADPGWQFEWMRKILSYCREKGTQAVIVGHIPPAVGSYRHTQLWKDRYIRTYYEIVKEFDNVITAQMFGHLHSDEFRVGLQEKYIYTTNLTMLPFTNSPILLGPSITPLHGNDPSFRIVKYGRRVGSNEFRFLDYDSYRFSMSTDSKWSKFYTFSETYSDASEVISKDGLTSETFRKIVESMEDKRGQESPVLKAYRSLMLSGAEGSGDDGRGTNVECDSSCRDAFICTITSASRAGYDNCLLERNIAWKESGSNIIGLVSGLLLGAMLIAFVVVRWKKKCKRDEYKSTPSVTDGNIDPEIAARDQEMI